MFYPSLVYLLAVLIKGSHLNLGWTQFPSTIPLSCPEDPNYFVLKVSPADLAKG